MVRVSRLIEQLSASGVIVFVVSHDFEFIVRTCTEVVQLDDQGAIQNHRLTPQILKTLSEKYDADLDLENAMTDLYISLQGTNLKDSNERDAKSLYESFQLYKDNYLIEEYNNGAVAFNNQLEEFPTNLFNAIYHFDKVELYQ